MTDTDDALFDLGDEPYTSIYAIYSDEAMQKASYHMASIDVVVFTH